MLAFATPSRYICRGKFFHLLNFKTTLLETVSLSCLLLGGSQGSTATMGSLPEHLVTRPDIIDIRREELGQSLLKETLSSLSPGNGEAPKLPTLLLYDGRSLGQSGAV